MRVRFLVGGTIGILAAACVDLFHSTDFETRGTVDAGPLPDLCADGGAEALIRAKRACALLGACETPIGQYKAGECLANAILAYDCDANKDRRPINDSEAFWRCMAGARTCSAVDSCAAPGGAQACGGASFVGCVHADSVRGDQADLRELCGIRSNVRAERRQRSGPVRRRSGLQLHRERVRRALPRLVRRCRRGPRPRLQSGGRGGVQVGGCRRQPGCWLPAGDDDAVHAEQCHLVRRKQPRERVPLGVSRDGGLHGAHGAEDLLADSGGDGITRRHAVDGLSGRRWVHGRHLRRRRDPACVRAGGDRGRGLCGCRDGEVHADSDAPRGPVLGVHAGSVTHAGLAEASSNRNLRGALISKPRARWTLCPKRCGETP
jgi:hypothetical protein